MFRTVVFPASKIMGAVGVLIVLTLSGCDKVPTWDELSNGKKADTTVVTTAPAPQQTPPLQPVKPVEPPKPTAEEILAAFKTLRPSEVSDQAIASLTSLDEGIEQVVEIDATAGRVTNEGLASIPKLTSLRTLKLEGTAVDDKGCEAIGKLPSLEVLTLTGSKITDVGVNHLKDLTHLKSLILDNTQLSHNGYVVLGQLPSLENLVIRHSSVDDEALEALCQAKTLHSLMISNAKVSDEGLEVLSNLDNLRKLHIDGCRVTCWNLGKIVQKNKNMKLLELSVAKTPLNDKGALAIGAIDSLEILSLFGLSGMTDAHLNAIISGKKDLLWLSIGQNPGLSNDSLAALKVAKKLEYLDVSENRNLSDAGLVHLTKLKNLKQLAIGNTGITPAGIESLKKYIPDLNKAGKIEFSFSNR